MIEGSKNIDAGGLFDAIVVGGGPAGLVCAETIASYGMSVFVMEQEEQIGWPVHTSGATALKTMEEFGIPNNLYHSIERIRFCSNNETANFDYPRPTGCVIDVTGVYQFLAERARTSGAIISTGTRATHPIIDHGAVVGCEAIRGNQAVNLRSKLLIDASGYRSSLSKDAVLHHGFKSFGVGAEY